MKNTITMENAVGKYEWDIGDEVIIIYANGVYDSRKRTREIIKYEYRDELKLSQFSWATNLRMGFVVYNTYQV